jgi:nucleoside-diphosphate-sugar epimerase
MSKENKKILIIGVNGFIGNRLTEMLLEQTHYTIYGFDLFDNNLENCLENPRFHFTKGDVTIDQDWIESHVEKCDVVLPLAAIATPATYVSDPLRIFELDFESNLAVIRLAAKYHTRIIFPSTSEVYGMCQDEAFDEETSPFITGPTNKSRWIYSCSKQLLDRVIHAYGEHEGLNYTLFRPFNWYGPKLDNIHNKKAGGSRALTQFLGNILRGEPIKLVDGGQQRRTFCYLDDGVQGIVKMIVNKDDKASNQIINLGNPQENASIREFAEQLLEVFAALPQHAHFAKNTKLVDISSEDYYGKGYQDVNARVPAIAQAKKLIDWTPTTNLKSGLEKTVAYYIKEFDVVEL